MKDRSYKTFGLKVLSDFELPELIKADGSDAPFDVEIKEGAVSGFKEDFKEDIILRANPDEITYQLKDIARCTVLNGKKAYIMPAPGIDNSTIRLLIHTSVFGCILLQRRMLPIHGSSVIADGKVLIIVGISGAGKSTLTSTFIKAGYKYLADDLSVICENENGELLVQPANPYRKLHKDSAEYHSMNLEDFERIDYEEAKYLIPEKEAFSETPERLAALIELVAEEREDVSITKLKGMAKLDVLMQNIYRGSLTTYFKSRDFYFTQMGRIASKIDVYRVSRPAGLFTCDKQIEIILDQLK